MTLHYSFFSQALSFTSDSFFSNYFLFNRSLAFLSGFLSSNWFVRWALYPCQLCQLSPFPLSFICPAMNVWMCTGNGDKNWHAPWSVCMGARYAEEQDQRAQLAQLTQLVWSQLCQLWPLTLAVPLCFRNGQSFLSVAVSFVGCSFLIFLSFTSFLQLLAFFF